MREFYWYHIRRSMKPSLEVNDGLQLVVLTISLISTALVQAIPRWTPLVVFLVVIAWRTLASVYLESVVLKNQLNPQFEIDFDATSNNYLRSQSHSEAGIENAILRLFRVSVRNTGTKTLEDVYLYLESIGRDVNGFRRGPLLPEFGAPTLDLSQQPGVTLHHKDIKFFEVADKRSQGIYRDSIYLRFAVQRDMLDKIPATRYCFTLVAKARDCPTVSRQFIVEVDGTGVLQVSPVLGG